MDIFIVLIYVYTTTNTNFPYDLIVKVDLFLNQMNYLLPRADANVYLFKSIDCKAMLILSGPYSCKI